MPFNISFSGVLKSLALLGDQEWLLRRTLPRYPYMIHPGGLSIICRCLDDTQGVDGAVVEIGCANGWTTLFVASHLRQRLMSRPQFAIDTFSGFTSESIDYEVGRRDGDSLFLKGAFSGTSLNEFQKTLKLGGYGAVSTIQSDITQMDWGKVGQTSFCLIDVDLYLPVKAALEKCYLALSRGGIILVHDCTPDGPWSGAYEAYQEFCRTHEMRECIVENMFGRVDAPEKRR